MTKDVFVDPVRPSRAQLEQARRAQRKRSVHDHGVHPADLPGERLCATPVSPGTTFEYTFPDIHGRPWAQIWERYFENGMQRPEDESIFDFSRTRTTPAAGARPGYSAKRSRQSR